MTIYPALRIPYLIVDSMDFHGKYDGITWTKHIFPWNTMEVHGQTWNSMDNLENVPCNMETSPWMSMESLDLIKKHMEQNGK